MKNWNVNYTIASQVNKTIIATGTIQMVANTNYQAIQDANALLLSPHGGKYGGKYYQSLQVYATNMSAQEFNPCSITSVRNTRTLSTL